MIQKRAKKTAVCYLLRLLMRVCGEGGDVFKLVGELTGIQKPVDVLKMLNRDFFLGFHLDNKLSEKEKNGNREES